MGNYKFKLSNMVPNAWFYKLNRTRNQNNITHATEEKHQQASSSSVFSEATATPALAAKMQQQPGLDHQRKSYHFTRDKPETPNEGGFYDNLPTKLTALESLNYPEPPRKSSRKRLSTKQNRRHSNRQSSPGMILSSSVPAGCNCGETLESIWSKTADSTPDDSTTNSSLGSSSEHESVKPGTFDGMLSQTAYCECRVDSDLVIHLEDKPFDAKFDDPDKQESFGTVPKLKLPPIITKPRTFDKRTQIINKRNSAKHNEERNAEEVVKASPNEQKSRPVRRCSANTPGVKLRTNSPRIASRRITGRRSVSSSSSSISSSRKDVLESFAVVKSSKDPQKDFKESMVEMIIENNMFASKDLEDLLACYLSLNSDDYHDLIIKVFQQIWFDVIDPRL